MISHDQVTRRPRAAANFLDDQLAGGRVCFSLPALMGVTGLSSTAAHYQLLRLGRRVVRISARFFLIVTPEFMLPEHRPRISGSTITFGGWSDRIIWGCSPPRPTMGPALRLSRLPKS